MRIMYVHRREWMYIEGNAVGNVGTYKEMWWGMYVHIRE
jgi:hypothetical protein